MWRTELETEPKILFPLETELKMVWKQKKQKFLLCFRLCFQYKAIYISRVKMLLETMETKYIYRVIFI